jgi:hypothetical protein
MRILTALFSMLVGVAAPPQAGVPSSAPAPQRDGDFQLRINGPVRIAGSDTASSVWVVNNNATVDGVVREGLGVINGTARVTGRIEGDIVVVNGRLELAPGARVERDVMLYRSTMTRAPGAVVAGAVREESGFSLGVTAMWLVWVSFTIVVVLAGLLFAEVAPKTLRASASYLSGHAGRSALSALVIACVLPVVAALSLATVIGIPLGLTLMFVVIPTLAFLGYLVSGAALGDVMMSQYFAKTAPADRRYRTVALGLLTLQVCAALPLIGGLLVFVASMLGVGGLVAHGWMQRERATPLGVPVSVAS